VGSICAPLGGLLRGKCALIRQESIYAKIDFGDLNVTGKSKRTQVLHKELDAFFAQNLPK